MKDIIDSNKKISKNSESFDGRTLEKDLFISLRWINY